MKKFVLIMMAFMVSFSAYAQEVTTNVEDEEVVVVSEPIVIDTVYLDGKYAETNTITITATLPPTASEIFYVSGPCTPQYLPSQYWSYGNRIITITYPSGDLTGIAGMETASITIYGRDAVYIINIIVY